MLRIVAAVAALAVGATVVYAQSAAIGQRKDILKTFGGALKEPGGMMKGEVPFDLAKVQASLKTLAEGAPKLKGLFPDDSKTGDTAALPTIWKRRLTSKAASTKWRPMRRRRQQPSRTKPALRLSGPRSARTAAAATRNTVNLNNLAGAVWHGHNCA